MNNVINNIFYVFRQKKKLFIFILILSIIACVLAIIAGVNFSEGVFSVDLNNICYIQYLKGDCGWFGLIFKLILSLLIFIILIVVFASKPVLFPISLIFYLYLIYSQIVVIVSLIVVYGIFNCVILILLLILYNIVLISIFIFLILDINYCCNCGNYFNNIFNYRNSNLLIYLMLILILCLIFSIILIVLKSFVLLLVF